MHLLSQDRTDLDLLEHGRSHQRAVAFDVKRDDSAVEGFGTEVAEIATTTKRSRSTRSTKNSIALVICYKGITVSKGSA